ncbi:hypothetical protein QN360_05315, partial [Glaciimonas sp. CA11.2]|uniref:hypothetical protein n=1 Tax=Glaciimonas sp. CA11.2 TaxID=3048601 RepID=UPI002B23719F
DNADNESLTDPYQAFQQRIIPIHLYSCPLIANWRIIFLNIDLQQFCTKIQCRQCQTFFGG